MATAVSACVHCGFCLPTCPTYLELGEEMDSPRGRIVLMKAVLEGEVDLDGALAHIDPCLGCEACVTSCPSGVAYAELLVPFRAYGESARTRSWPRRLLRGLTLDLLASPRRLRLAVALGRAVRPLRWALPPRLRAPLELLGSNPRAETEAALPVESPARGPRQARVALLAGCAQQLLRPQLNRATVEVLTRCGVEVVVPPGQSCCGSLALHAGELVRARECARRNLKVLSGGFDAVLTNAAGCGSGMKSYGLLFKGEPEEEGALSLAAKTLDVTTFLSRIDVPALPPLPQAVTAVYQDACHLLHAQGESEAPRRLLAAVPNLTLVEALESQICCGSAGIYNLEHPELASRLGERKVRCLVESGADTVVSGNVGCLVQIEAHLRRLGERQRVVHTLELLAESYGAE